MTDRPKIVQFRKDVGINPDLITEIESVLARAKAGEITGFVAGLEMADGTWGLANCFADCWGMSGYLHYLARWVIDDEE